MSSSLKRFIVCLVVVFVSLACVDIQATTDGAGEKPVRDSHDDSDRFDYTFNTDLIRIENDIVYVVSSMRYSDLLVALTRGGEVIWQRCIEGKITSWAFDGDLLIVMDKDRTGWVFYGDHAHIRGLDPQTGEQLWLRDHSASGLFFGTSKIVD